MRLTFDPRTRRLLGALPRTSLYAVSELLLLAVLAWQLARLVWAIVTPVSPLGAWRPADAGAVVAAPGILGGFDPFFRLSAGSGAAVVTDLDLKLYGVRADQATGRGSAIIGLPDGRQASVAVGEQIVPGVTLQAVRMDGVTILRGGVPQMLFLDQSRPATSVAGAAAGAGSTRIGGPPPPPIPGLTPPSGIGAGGVAPSALAAQIGASPRIAGGRIDGFTLQPQGDGAAFRAAGLQPGDVLVSIDGVRVLNADSIAALPDLVGRDAQATLEVERGGRIVPLSVKIAR